MNPHAPSPVPIASMPSYDTGTSTCAAVTTGFATPESAALKERPGRVPPPSSTITASSGVPSVTSATPARSTSPTTVQIALPGDCVVPSERNQSTPRSRIGTTLARVSTLLTSVGFDPAPRRVVDGWLRRPADLRAGGEQPVEVRREQPGQRVLPFDHREQRLLLTEEVLVGPLDDGDRHVAEESVDPHLVHGPVDRGTLRRERRLDREERVHRADRLGGDHEPLEHLVRVGREQRTILERAGLALGTVRDDEPVAELGAALAHRRPLAPRRKAGAAAPVEARLAKLLHHAVGPQLPGGIEARASAAFPVLAERP